MRTGGPAPPRGTVAKLPWRERVGAWVGRLLFVSAFFSLLAIVFADGLIVRAVSDTLGLLDMPVEPSIFLVCLLFALAGAARRRLRAAHTVVVIIMLLNVFYSAVCGDRRQSGRGGLSPCWAARSAGSVTDRHSGSASVNTSSSRHRVM